jgi:AAA15 family ATPase/GTPase
MIRRVKIENYKSLKAAEVPLKELSVVLGPNAAGKSNLFDDVNLYAASKQDRGLNDYVDETRAWLKRSKAAG